MMSRGKGRRAGRQAQPESLGDAPEAESTSRPWRIRYLSSVRDTDLETISTAAARAAQKAIDKKLKVDPQQYGEFLHRPLQGLYKLKTSSVRIVYHVDAEAREVWVLAIGERRDIWQDQRGILKRWDAARGELRPDDVTSVEEKTRSAVRGRGRKLLARGGRVRRIPKRLPTRSVESFDHDLTRHCLTKG